MYQHSEDWLQTSVLDQLWKGYDIPALLDTSVELQMIQTCSQSATQVAAVTFRQVRGYLHIGRLSPPFGQYEIILLANRGTGHMYVNSLPRVVTRQWSWTRDLSIANLTRKVTPLSQGGQLVDYIYVLFTYFLVALIL